MGKDDGEGTWTLTDGTTLTLRHIGPADAAREQAFVQGLSAQSSQLRFHGTLKELSRKDLAQLTEPDSRSEVALIVLHRGAAGDEEIGVARYAIDPDRASCEFAIVVADAWQRRGIGSRLMKALESHLRSSGVKQITGSVIRGNAVMRSFVKRMGFAESGSPDDPSTLRVIRRLG